MLAQLYAAANAPRIISSPAAKHDQSVADSDVTVDYLADKVWIVGSPKTAAEKLAKLRRHGGRFRLHACRSSMTICDDMGAYRASMTALQEEVLPANFSDYRG